MRVTELRELKEFLSDPSRFAALGAEIPRGILLYGPPGCGKTMLARALAAEAGASFFSISGSDFVELYVGVGASRVRDLFREAREAAPSLIFIDELDSVGRARSAGGALVSQGEQEQALNQILTEMDGFSSTDGVIVVAATNRPDVLDPALLRPGRFDRTVGLERPDEGARLAILGTHARGKALDPDVDLGLIARRAVGMTGADLASIMNEAALLAGRARRATISQTELEAGLAAVLSAPERQRRLSMRERSVGRRFTGEDQVTFADVAGQDAAVTRLSEIRDYLTDPDRFAALGGVVPRGVLIFGPPGCGKTLLARALASEANAAFFSVAATEFVNTYVGAGAARVRDMFAEARSMAPSIVFIDEIDSIGTHRSAFTTDGGREYERTLNQLLVELDGFEPNSTVVVMAATNRPELLDAALVRPGRFDRMVTIAPPNRAGRLAILRLHAARKQLGDDVDLDAVAGVTRGLSGADLENILNEAALLATRRGLERISMAVLDEGVDRATFGLVSHQAVMTDEERSVVAYHEAGHAIVSLALPGAMPPHKLTILPRGRTLGHCSMMDTHDRFVWSRTRQLDEMASLLGGWVAERLVFGEAGSGASGDLERVGNLARRMVIELGMSEDLGPLAFPAANGPGRYSEREAGAISVEVRRLADEAHDRATGVLRVSRARLDAVAADLLQRETMTSDEISCW